MDDAIAAKRPMIDVHSRLKAHHHRIDVLVDTMHDAMHDSTHNKPKAHDHQIDLLVDTPGAFSFTHDGTQMTKA